MTASAAFGSSPSEPIASCSIFVSLSAKIGDNPFVRASIPGLPRNVGAGNGKWPVRCGCVSVGMVCNCRRRGKVLGGQGMFVSCRLCPVRHREPEREQKPARADRYGTVRGQRSAFGAEDDEWHHHLLHRDAAVLERVLVVTDVFVRIVRVGEEIVPGGEDIGGGQVALG